MLRMLDAPAKVITLDAHRRPRTLIQVEYLTNATVTDRVRIDLETVFHGNLGGSFDILDGLQHETVSVRQVLVGLEQPGAVRTKRTVDLSLDRANSEEVISFRQHPVLGQYLVHHLVRRPAHHYVQPNRQVALRLELFEKLDAFEGRARILERGNAVPKRFVSREHHTLAIDLFHLFRCQPTLVDTDDCAEKALRRFPHQPGRSTVWCPHDRATRWIRRFIVNAGRLQRCIVIETRMPAGMTQRHRVVR